MRIRDFGGYKLQEVIGGGMYTKVYKAQSFLAKSPHGQTAAIKILNIKGQSSENRKLVAQFEREAVIAMALSHPNVVKVHNFGKYNNQYAIIMEYVDGSNFKEALYKPEKLPLGVLLNICDEAGKGLAYIHRNNIVHKDVKPDNILVSEDFKTVKITDFGIAKLPKKIWHKDFFPKSGTITKFGIVSYIAPEQKEGRAGFCSDIYSFGITMDEVITAKLLIEGSPGKNSEDYFKRMDVRSYRKKTGKQDILCSDLPVPGALKNIIARATNLNCQFRYNNMEQLLSELELLL